MALFGWFGVKRVRGKEKKKELEGKVFVFQVYRKYKLYLRFDLSKCDLQRKYLLEKVK